MHILAIESSCDETAAAVLFYDEKSSKKSLLSSVVVSQIDIFKAYGGVIPEVAARSHLEAILPVIHKALTDAFPNKTEPEAWKLIDYLAVTNTPGLLGSLLIGTLTARTLSILHNIPLYPIHHLKSHIYSAFLASGEKAPFEEDPELQRGLAPEPRNDGSEGRASKTDFRPQASETVALVVSGGHTQLIYMPSPTSFKIIGTTLDDAVGEAFDKIAKILGLPYPGGPSISVAAKTGDPEKYHFPHPNVKDLDFSFSGLKTAVLRTVQKELSLPLNYPSHDIKNLLSPEQVADFAASFQRTAVDILIEKLSLALKKYPDVNNVVIAGGVSANEELRKRIALKNPKKPNIFFPEKRFSGDNAAMVALPALSEILSGIPPSDPYSLKTLPHTPIS